MKILALDTSSDACSVAVLNDGECHAKFVLEARAHTRLILPMVEALMAQAGLALADLDALAFGRGPGAFTGVRIATGVVQGLALAADKPVIPVSTLAAVALQAGQEQQADQVLVALDARMSEVYWGAFCGVDGPAEQLRLIGEEQVIAPQDTPLPKSIAEPGWLAAGSGWQVYQDVLKERFSGHVRAYYPDYLPAAEHIASLAMVAWQRGEAVDAALAQPIYLRNKVAQTIRERAGNL